MNAVDVERLLVEATNGQRLQEVVQRLRETDGDEMDEDARRLVVSAYEVCRRIESATANTERSVLSLLIRNGVQASRYDFGPPGAGTQFEQVHLHVPLSALDAAVAIMRREGFVPWEAWTGGAWSAFVRTHSRMTLIRADEGTTRLVFHWFAPRPQSIWTRIFRPTAADFDLVRLPRWAWPVYYALRPVRLLVERLRDTDNYPSQWPYLGTPIDLIGPLLEFADVTARDRLVDLGCGDGRVVATAARSTGCTAIGVERDPALVELARGKCGANDIRHLTAILEGDARHVNVEDASVLFLFLPASEIDPLIRDFMTILKPGARIVAHEQSGIRAGFEPDRTRLVLADSAVTVAHLWTISSRTQPE